MKKRFVFALLSMSLIAVCPLDGQNAAPEAEVFGGVTKVWGRTKGNRFDEGGGEVSVTGYFNRVIGLEANLNTFSNEVPNAPAYGTEFSLLFGPHITYHRSPWVNPFAHGLIGLSGGNKGSGGSPRVTTKQPCNQRLARTWHRRSEYPANA